MSKLVYKMNDRVQVRINGIIYETAIRNSEVDPPDAETGESTIHYIDYRGMQFTDADIVEDEEEE